MHICFVRAAATLCIYRGRRRYIRLLETSSTYIGRLSACSGRTSARINRAASQSSETLVESSDYFSLRDIPAALIAINHWSQCRGSIFLLALLYRFVRVREISFWLYLILFNTRDVNFKPLLDNKERSIWSIKSINKTPAWAVNWSVEVFKRRYNRFCNIGSLCI